MFSRPRLHLPLNARTKPPAASVIEVRRLLRRTLSQAYAMAFGTLLLPATLFAQSPSTQPIHSARRQLPPPPMVQAVETPTPSIHLALSATGQVKSAVPRTTAAVPSSEFTPGNTTIATADIPNALGSTPQSNIPTPPDVGSEATRFSSASWERRAPSIEPQEVDGTIEPSMTAAAPVTADAASWTAAQLACRAAQCWGPSRLLLQRAATLEESNGVLRLHSRDSVEAQIQFLKHQAAWQQDLVAAGALKSAFTVLAFDAQLEQAERGLALTAEQSAAADALSAKGIAPSDPTAMARRRLGIEDQCLQLLKGRTLARITLAQLTSLPECNPILVAESLDVQPRCLDCDALIREALSHRSDYRGWQMLATRLDKSNVAAISEIISSTAGNIGLVEHHPQLVDSLWAKLNAGQILERVRNEIHTVTDLQRRLIESAVCERCNVLKIAYERVITAQELLDSWNQRVAALERLAELGHAQPEALGEAKAKQIEATASLIQRQLEARLAEIDLAESCGGLAQRCCSGEEWKRGG